MLSVFKEWWKSNTIGTFDLLTHFAGHLPKRTHTRGKNAHAMFPSLGFVDEFGLLGLWCHQPLPQLICFLPAEQKEGVRHGPWAKNAMWESAKPRDWKVDNCLFTNKSPASEHKCGYAELGFRGRRVKRERGRKKRYNSALTSLHPRPDFRYSECFSSVPGPSFSAAAHSAFFLPSRRVSDDPKESVETTEETIKEATMKSSTLALVQISANTDTVFQS